MQDSLTIQDLYDAEELLYVDELEWLDKEYAQDGYPKFLIAHTHADLPRALVVWCRRVGCEILRTPYVEEDMEYIHTPRK